MVFKKYKNFYSKYGFIKTLKRLITKPVRIINKNKSDKEFVKKKEMIFKLTSLKEKFEYIHSTNFWPSGESISGPGSELKNTKNIRNGIKNLIEDYKINKILDAPCGDFNWMKFIINKNIDYVGGDIVKEIVFQNLEKHGKKNVNFIELDVIKNNIPEADLFICRDCLIHFSISNIKKFFANVKKSNINYILLTSYESKTQEINKDIEDGDFRPIFLRQTPFNLPTPILKIFDKDEEHKNNSNLSCYLYLYSKNQLN